MRLASTCIVFLTLVGCGQHGSGKIDGTVNGNSFEVNSASFAVTRDTGVPLFLLALWSAADACAAMGDNNRHANAEGLVMVLYNADPNGQSSPPGVGSYSVVSNTPQAGGAYAQASFSELDSSCNQQLPDNLADAVGGQVVLQSVASGETGHAKGTFDLNVGVAGDHVTGSFDAVPCAAMLTFRSTGTHGCD